MDDALKQQLDRVLGTRPIPPTVPPPGIYWLKRLQCGFYWRDADGRRLNNPTHNQIYSQYTWDTIEESKWFLARIQSDTGDYECLGSDEIYEWEYDHQMISQVGTKVEEP